MTGVSARRPPSGEPRKERRKVRVLGKRLLALAIALTIVGLQCSGCIFFGSEESYYVSNSEALEAVARSLQYEVDPALYRLVSLELREDSAAFRYNGVKFVGDRAWVIRFSAKSSEQDLESLADVYSLLPVIAEDRPGLAVKEGTKGEGERSLGKHKVRFVRYAFPSEIGDEKGQPLQGHGIIAAFKTGESGEVLVYHLKLDNHGDREDVRWEDLAPFLDPALLGGS
jgi:hypothetical protein